MYRWFAAAARDREVTPATNSPLLSSAVRTLTFTLSAAPMSTASRCPAQAATEESLLGPRTTRDQPRRQIFTLPPSAGVGLRAPSHRVTTRSARFPELWRRMRSARGPPVAPNPSAVPAVRAIPEAGGGTDPIRIRTPDTRGVRVPMSAAADGGAGVDCYPDTVLCRIGAGLEARPRTHTRDSRSL